MDMEYERQRKPPIEVEEISENIRVYSTGSVKDDAANDIILGISRHPSVGSVRAITGGPLLRFEVVTSSPEDWNINLDPHCRMVIEIAMEI
jgi:hypothetical protein